MSFHYFDMSRMRALESYHLRTQQIIDRAIAIGAVLPNNLGIFDNYVRSMVDIWNLYMDIFFRFQGTGDVQFKRINLANPEGSLAEFYGGLTIDNAGIKGNGTNAYVSTNFNSSLLVSGQKYQLNDASRGGIIVETQSGGVIDGVRTSAVNALTNGSSGANRINQTVNGGGDYSGIGLKIINRTNSNTVIGINKDISFSNAYASASLINEVQILLSRQSTYSSIKLRSYFMGKSIPFDVSQTIRYLENADMAALGLPQIA